MTSERARCQLSSADRLELQSSRPVAARLHQAPSGYIQSLWRPTWTTALSAAEDGSGSPPPGSAPVFRAISRLGHGTACHPDPDTKAEDGHPAALGVTSSAISRRCRGWEDWLRLRRRRTRSCCCQLAAARRGAGGLGGADAAGREDGEGDGGTGVRSVTRGWGWGEGVVYVSPL